MGKLGWRASRNTSTCMMDGQACPSSSVATKTAVLRGSPLLSALFHSFLVNHQLLTFP
jgi:hypothetical protein